MSIEPSSNAPQALTNEQQAALAKLHKTAQGMESLFINMMFTEMRKSAPQGGGLTGKESSAEETFGGMLDEERAKNMAEAGGLGIGKILEQQLRASVLGSVAPASSGAAAETATVPEATIDATVAGVGSVTAPVRPEKLPILRADPLQENSTK